MTANVGGWDRNTRWILGTGALLAGLMAPLPRGWRIGLLGFGATELITAATQYCPVNKVLGLNTHPSRVEEAGKVATRVAREMVR